MKKFHEIRNQFHEFFFFKYLFVGRKSSDFTDEIPDELVVVGLFALVLGRPFLQFIGSGLMTFVQTGADFVFWRHSVTKKNDKRLEYKFYYSIIIYLICFSDFTNSIAHWRCRGLSRARSPWGRSYA